MFRHGLLMLVAVVGTTAAARADVIYVNTTDHSDVEVVYDATANRLGLVIGLDDLGLDFPTNQVLTVVGPNGRFARPAAYGFLGVPPGAPYWAIPQDPEPGRPLLGVGAGEDDESPDGFFNNPLRIRVLAVRGPGNVAVFRDVLGGVDVFANSADGLGPLDELLAQTVSHQDYTWAFTAPGYYQVDVRVSGVRSDGSGTVTSDVFTLNFAVDTPEPASVAVFALVGGVGLIAARRRSR